MAGAEEGPRLLSTNLSTNNLGLFTPQTNAFYTVRAYNFDFSSLLLESSQISVSAAPDLFPAQVGQLADTNRTSSSATVNWTATGTSYRVLARPGVATTYGNLVDTTVSATSINLTGRAAGSTPRCLIIPENANGRGMTSNATFSSVIL